MLKALNMVLIVAVVFELSDGKLRMLQSSAFLIGVECSLKFDSPIVTVISGLVIETLSQLTPLPLPNMSSSKYCSYIIKFQNT